MKTKILIINLLLITFCCAENFDTKSSSIIANWLSADQANDLNNDGVVNFIDYAIYMDQWKTKIEKTLVLPLPSAVDITDTASTYTLYQITLSGADYNDFYISSLPANGKLYDIFPLCFFNTYQEIKKPCFVKKLDNKIYYLTDSLTADSFTYQTYYRKKKIFSAPATVTINKSDYAKNSLSFDGTGYVEIPHNAAVDFASPVSFVIWFKPKSEFGGIIEKGDFKIYLKSQRLHLEINGSKILVTKKITLDQWYGLGITIGTATPANNCLSVTNEDFSYNYWLQRLTYTQNANTSNVIIGKNFIGQIDKFIWSSSLGWFNLVVSGTEDRTEYDTTWAVSTSSAKAYYKCDEGTGTAIANSVVGLTLNGTLHNVSWTPNSKPKNLKIFYHLFN